MANVRIYNLFLLLYLQPSSHSTLSKQNTFNKLKDSAFCSLYVSSADTAFYPLFYPNFRHYLYLKHTRSPGFTICSGQKRVCINASVKLSETWPNCFTQLFSHILNETAQRHTAIVNDVLCQMLSIHSDLIQDFHMYFVD